MEESSKFKFEVVAHKDNNYWVRLYKYNIGTDFYLHRLEATEFLNMLLQKSHDFVQELSKEHDKTVQSKRKAKIVKKTNDPLEWHIESPPKKERIYKVGQRFVREDIEIIYEDEESDEFQDEYILAQVSGKKVCLIRLTDGVYWNKAVKVKNSYAITENEFEKLNGDMTSVFHVIGE